MLCENDDVDETELRYTRQETTSDSLRFEEVKSEIAESKSSDYDTVRSSQSTVLHDDQEVDTTTDEMIRDALDLRLQDKTLQRKEELMSRCSKSKIEFDDQEKEVTSSLSVRRTYEEYDYESSSFKSYSSCHSERSLASEN